MQQSKVFNWKKLVGVVILIGLIILRWVSIDDPVERMDNTFLLLIVISVAIVFLPWERINTFKAAGVEFVLDKPSIESAIIDVSRTEVAEGVKRSTSKEVEQLLQNLTPFIKQIQGARVIWIDDYPGKSLSLRRMLRFLGVVVVMAKSSEAASAILETDNDFDLLITDVQRDGKYYQFNHGTRIHDGVNFVVWLRTTQDKDLYVKTLPVLFYAAYEWSRLVEYTMPAKKTQPDVDYCNAPLKFLEKSIIMLAKSRTQTLPILETKEKTRV